MLRWSSFEKYNFHIFTINLSRALLKNLWYSVFENVVEFFNKGLFTPLYTSFLLSYSHPIIPTVTTSYSNWLLVAGTLNITDTYTSKLKPFSKITHVSLPLLLDNSLVKTIHVPSQLCDVFTNAKNAFSILWYHICALANDLEMKYISLWWVSESLIKTTITNSSSITSIYAKLPPEDGRVSTGGKAKVFFKYLKFSSQSIVHLKSVFFLNS